MPCFVFVLVSSVRVSSRSSSALVCVISSELEPLRRRAPVGGDYNDWALCSLEIEETCVFELVSQRIQENIVDWFYPPPVGPPLSRLATVRNSLLGPEGLI